MDVEKAVVMVWQWVGVAVCRGLRCKMIRVVAGRVVCRVSCGPWPVARGPSKSICIIVWAAFVRLKAGCRAQGAVAAAHGLSVEMVRVGVGPGVCWEDRAGLLVGSCVFAMWGCVPVLIGQAAGRYAAFSTCARARQGADRPPSAVAAAKRPACGCAAVVRLRARAHRRCAKQGGARSAP